MTGSLMLLPVYVVDFVGSGLMIVFALMAFHYSSRLTRLDPKSVIWTYLFWLSMALVALAVSRGVGHILRFVFILTGYPQVWKFLSPYSGGLNTLAFMAVAVLTFYIHNVHTVILRVREDTESLAKANTDLEMAHNALHHLNQTLEQRVEERTSLLRLSEQRFRRLFEGSKDMIFFCNANGQIDAINDSGVELLGYDSQEDLTGKPLATFFIDEEKWSRYYCKLGSGGHVKDLEAEFLKKDGSHLYLMITSSAITDEKGNVQGFEGIAKDLTHFKKVTDQLIQSESLASVGQLAAGVAHEINTPLGIILGYTQLLEEDFENQQDVLETLRTIEKQTKVCKRIVADLLKFSRHSVEGTTRPIDINACLEEVLTVMEHTLNMDRIYFQRSLAIDLPRVIVDSERIRQVFVNIITNAHHAIGNEGIVGVWSRFDPHCQEVEIIIGNTGPGIPPEIIGRIFDPFFTTKGASKGTGLGLSVSFGIIKDYGGQIEVYSPPHDPELIDADMQTAFHVYLPTLQAGDKMTKED